MCLPCSLYPLDFAVLVDVTDSDPAQWSVDRVWYCGALYPSLDHLADSYHNDPSTNKTRVRHVRKAKTRQSLRGDPSPQTPQRPPVQVGDSQPPLLTSPPPLSPETPCAACLSKTPHLIPGDPLCRLVVPDPLPHPPPLSPETPCAACLSKTPSSPTHSHSLRSLVTIV